MAATAEAPVAEVAATTTATATKQAPSSKQAEEPVPVVSSLASVYPDGNRRKIERQRLPVGTGRLRSLFVLFFVKAAPYRGISFRAVKEGTIKSAATSPARRL